jgi:hypothetical protein
MARFYFPAEYDGFTYGDDQGEDFPTVAAAVAHAKVVAAELGRNNTKAVTVFLVTDDGAQTASVPAGGTPPRREQPVDSRGLGASRRGSASSSPPTPPPPGAPPR